MNALIEELLSEQQTLTAVERFSRLHDSNGAPASEKFYRDLIPMAMPRTGEQYAFVVDLDKCSGCKSCVSACHSLNGLDEEETWRSVGLLVTSPRSDIPFTPHALAAPKSDAGGSRPAPIAFQQHVTSACHHCVDPACLNGCPVLAYDKDPITGIVRHLDDQCIGCSYCIMKCPYEVPKYSETRGIVRKCDMCSNRLAAGEAPACVQACPSEAIRIEIVEQDSVRARFRPRSSISQDSVEARSGSSDSFLPDSPDPRITVPSTRYLSRHPFSSHLVAADHDAVRLEPPHWPLVVMLVLTQAAAGLFAAAAVMQFWGAFGSLLPLEVSGLLLLCAGLAASVAHLGQPLKAWRAFLGWRRSWLSREVIALTLFGGLAVILASLEFSARWPSGLLRHAWLAAVALSGLSAVFASSMVYIDTKRPFWAARFTLWDFFGTAVVLGAGFSGAILLGIGQVRAAQFAFLIALATRGVLDCWRHWELRAATRDPENPIWFNARVSRELLPWTASARISLLSGSILAGLLATGNILGVAAAWGWVGAFMLLVSEIVGRFVFFSAGGSRRMPGGIAV